MRLSRSDGSASTSQPAGRREWPKLCPHRVHAEGTAGNEGKYSRKAARLAPCFASAMRQLSVSRWFALLPGTVAIFTLAHCGGKSQVAANEASSGGSTSSAGSSLVVGDAQASAAGHGGNSAVVAAGAGDLAPSGGSSGSSGSGGVAGSDKAIAVGHGGVGNAGTTHCRPILSQTGLDTGFEKCDDGTQRRRAAVQCPSPETSASDVCGPCVGPYCCVTDADCNQEPNGFCANAHHLAGYCGCLFGCVQDSDCGAGSICQCGSPVLGFCTPATCVTNADCGPGFGCLVVVQSSADDLGAGGAAARPACSAADQFPGDGYACQTDGEECAATLTSIGGGA
jgi:hypothetical protein